MARETRIRPDLEYDVVTLHYQRRGLATEGKSHNLSRMCPVGFNCLINRKGHKIEYAQKDYRILVVITMYNEAIKELNDTLDGIYANLTVFEEHNIRASEIGVCIVVDGMKAFTQGKSGEELDQHFADYRHIFDSRLVKRKFGVDDLNDCSLPAAGEPFAHVFFAQTRFGRRNCPPADLYLCVKQENAGKIDSHLWFFGGFCGISCPDYVMILDVGTKPEGRSLYYMWEAMERDPNLAGCCGEIKPQRVKCWDPLVDAQFVEYKFAHIFDKGLESLVGYITVLPGAFSAYRWPALDDKPLWVDYFKPHFDGINLTPGARNMYLAEDRILCLSLVTMPNQAYRLKYLNYASAETDVPDRIGKFLLQRRRWINGSWFALMHFLRHSPMIVQQKHFWLRKVFLFLLVVYSILNTLFSWFLVSFFFLLIVVSLKEIEGSDGDDVGSIEFWATLLYMLALIFIILSSVAVHPEKIERPIKVVSYFLGVCFIANVCLVFYTIATNDYDGSWLSWLIVAGIATIAFNIVLNWEIWTISRNVFQFLLMTPAYVNILYIYAICNTHDLTWGNRDSKVGEEAARQKEDTEFFRWKWLLLWLFSNLTLGFVVYELDHYGSDSTFVFIIAGTGGVMLVLRALCGVIYRFQQWYDLLIAKRLSRRYRENGAPERPRSRQRRRKSHHDDGDTPVHDTPMSPTILLDQSSAIHGQSDVVYEHPVRFPGAEEHKQRQDTPPKPLRSSSKIHSVIPNVDSDRHNRHKLPPLRQPSHHENPVEPQQSGKAYESHYNSDDEDEFEFYS